MLMSHYISYLEARSFTIGLVCCPQDIEPSLASGDFLISYSDALLLRDSLPAIFQLALPPLP
jgi:hypothetical protein